MTPLRFVARAPLGFLLCGYFKLLQKVTEDLSACAVMSNYPHSASRPRHEDGEEQRRPAQSVVEGFWMRRWIEVREPTPEQSTAQGEKPCWREHIGFPSANGPHRRCPETRITGTQVERRERQGNSGASDVARIGPVSLMDAGKLAEGAGARKGRSAELSGAQCCAVWRPSLSSLAHGGGGVAGNRTRSRRCQAWPRAHQRRPLCEGGAPTPAGVPPVLFGESEARQPESGTPAGWCA